MEERVLLLTGTASLRIQTNEENKADFKETSPERYGFKDL
jgi:hypothetical protein